VANLACDAPPFKIQKSESHAQTTLGSQHQDVWAEIAADEFKQAKESDSLEKRVVTEAKREELQQATTQAKSQLMCMLQLKPRMKRYRRQPMKLLQRPGRRPVAAEWTFYSCQRFSSTGIVAIPHQPKRQGSC